MGRLLAETLDLDVVAQRVAERVRTLLGAHHAAIFRLESESGDLVTVAVAGETGHTHVQGHVFPKGTPAGLAVRDRCPVVTSDVVSDTRFTLPPDLLAKDLRPYGIGVSVVCPMGVATRIGASERNRPDRLKNAAPGAAEPVELMGRTLAPETVAAMTVAAIRENRLYVLTHEEGLDPLRRRWERLERAILDRT